MKKFNLIIFLSLAMVLPIHAQMAASVQTTSQKILKSKTAPSLPNALFPEDALPLWESRDETNAGNTLLPPFGLKWGQNPESIISWCERREYKRREYQQEDKKTLEVTGSFQNMEFQVLRFHFLKDGLAEVELQYPSKPSETEGLLQLEKIKQIVERTKGSGYLQPEERGQEKNTFWRLNRYTWESPQTAVWLVCFQVKQEVQKKQFETRSITSLHYRNIQKLN